VRREDDLDIETGHSFLCPCTSGRPCPSYSSRFKTFQAIQTVSSNSRFEMFTRILTDLERKQAKTYLKQDGERTLNIKILTVRARKYLPQIREDLELLEKVLATYERDKTK
jgi:hypothetical protein